MIAPEKCFQLYLSVKAHFTSENYDAVKYNGKIRNADKTHLAKRKDCSLFSILSKNFSTGQEAASFFVANFAYGNEYPLVDFDRSECLYKKWQKNRQSLTKVFSDDIHILQERCINRNDFISGELPPKPYVLFKSGKINIETLAIIEQLDPYLYVWKGQILIKQDALRIQKLSSFIRFNEQKLRPIYQNLETAER